MSDVPVAGPVCALEDLFADPQAWEVALRELLAQVALVAAEPPAEGVALRLWLQRLDGLQRQQGRLSTYVGIQGFVDGRASEPQRNSARLRESGVAIGQRLAALNALLVVTDEAVWAQWLQAEPELGAYAGRYRSLRAGRHHVLSADVERALAALDASLQLPVQLYRRIKAGDLRFAEVEDAAGERLPFSLSRFDKRFETSPDARLRASAARVFAEGVETHRHAFAAAYAGEVSRQVSLARLRGFSDTLDLLFWQQGIDRAFFEALRAVFNEGLAPLMRRFAEVKRRLLGLPKLAFHDLKAYPPQIPGEVSFDFAREAILAAGQALGDDYAAVLRRAFDERWVEHGQQPHKVDNSGCASPFGPHPYVLMSWTGSPRDMFLLAHELGHAVHFHWSAEHQAVLNAAPLRYFIEAPSTLNELLLAAHLLRSEDAAQRLSAVFELLNSYYHNFVTHYLESEFQVRVYHEADAGRLPGAEALERIKTQVLRDFWGDAVDIDDTAGLTWLRQQHYYMGLYPYTYAAGQSIASLYQVRLSREPEAAERWCAALRQGSSIDAATLLQQLDLDLRDGAAFREVLGLIDGHVTQLEQLAQPYFSEE